MEPESPIRELFCCDCHAVPTERFLTFDMSFLEEIAGFYKKILLEHPIKEAALPTTEVTSMRQLINQKEGCY